MHSKLVITFISITIQILISKFLSILMDALMVTNRISKFTLNCSIETVFGKIISK